MTTLAKPGCPPWCEMHTGPDRSAHASSGTRYNTKEGHLTIRIEQRPEDPSPLVVVAETPGTSVWRLPSPDVAEDLADEAAANGFRAFAVIIRETARGGVRNRRGP